ncbi:Dabb family protein [Orenia marismortui]|uniref:Dabb family protein n=1 Tax=Orenia marismortui TaxID=46469 RepID=UPI00037BE601|nr:Dabb family protein [Orenia marismortui]
MIKHIVMWKLKESTIMGAEQAENAQKAKKILEGLKGEIEEIKFIEVGVNLNSSEAAYDLVLYSEFASEEDLEKYQKDPAHLKVAEFIREITKDRAVVDYKL